MSMSIGQWHKNPTQTLHWEIMNGNHVMEFMCIVNRMPIIPVPIFVVVVVLTIQQTFNEWLLFPRYPGIWGAPQKATP